MQAELRGLSLRLALTDGRPESARIKYGKCKGRKPFGHTPEEQATIARMRVLREQGCNDVTIAATLNAEQLKPRKAASWSSAVVARILDRHATNV